MVLGLMSGTSLDGLDMALVRFERKSSRHAWQFSVLDSNTIPYPTSILMELKEAISWQEEAILDLDEKLGIYIGERINEFLKNSEIKPDLIASHGHTIRHLPERGLTLQIGSGEMINRTTGLPVINNFRAADVAAGGQGAPLVPIGDRDLFSAYDMALNLGGIANISFSRENKRYAFDVCPFNMALNELAELIGKPFDNEGQEAAKGRAIPELLKQLNNIPFLKKEAPKSLGLEDYLQYWKPILKHSNESAQDKMRTYVEHAAAHIANCVNSNFGKKVLVTGGGAYHQFFIQRLEKLSNAEILVPENRIVEFKEAIVFAYLGLLRWDGKPNCLASVTGASHDVSGGDMHGF